MNNEKPYLNIANIDLKDGSVIFDSYAQTDTAEANTIMFYENGAIYFVY